MKTIGEVNSNYEDDSDDDSFNSCVGYLQSDLYDDVLFHHAIVPKDTVEQDVPLMRQSDSLFYGNRSNQWQQKRNNTDGESMTSSHMLSSGASNDDDLSFITDDTSFEEKMENMGMGMGMGRGMGMLVVSSEEKEEQHEDMLHWEHQAPKNSEYVVTPSSNLDEWSMMSDPDDDIIFDLGGVTSATESPPASDQRSANSTGYFGRSTF